MKFNKKILIISLLFLLLTITSVSAFMPRHTHKLIHQSSLSTPVDSDLYRACVNFPSLCYSGNVLTDVSVIWYYTEGQKYLATHSPNFCRELLRTAEGEQELACAVGGCMHLPADIVSHTDIVPYSIEHSGLANYVIHVFAEQKVDNWVEKEYPEIGDQAINYMNDYETCVPLFLKVMLRNSEYNDTTSEDVRQKFDKFITEIQTSQTGYDTAYKKKGFSVNIKTLPFSLIAIYSTFMLFWLLILVLLIVKLIKRQGKARHYIAIIIFGLLFSLQAWIFIANLQGNVFATIITIVKPISSIVPLGASEEFYVNQAITNTKNFLQQGEIWLEKQDPSGFDALDAADKKILVLDYILMTVLAALLGLYLWFLFKKNKIKPTKTFSSEF